MINPEINIKKYIIFFNIKILWVSGIFISISPGINAKIYDEILSFNLTATHSNSRTMVKNMKKYIIDPKIPPLIIPSAMRLSGTVHPTDTL